MVNVTEKSKQRAIELFLRSIGVKQCDVFQNLQDALSSYVDDKYKHNNCCVLWYKSLDDSDSKLSKILKEYDITPKYSKFSIIIRDASVSFSKKYGVIPVLFYTDPDYVPEKPKTTTYVDPYGY